MGLEIPGAATERLRQAVSGSKRRSPMDACSPGSNPKQLYVTAKDRAQKHRGRSWEQYRSSIHQLSAAWDALPHDDPERLVGIASM